MKRFSFRLERVLSFRESQRRQAELELRLKQQRQAELNKHADSIEQNGTQLQQQRVRESETTGLALRTSEAYLDTLHARRLRLREEQEANQRLTDQAMDTLIEHDRQVKLLEKLQARRRADHQRLEDREEQVQSGEQSVNRWRRSNP